MPSKSPQLVSIGRVGKPHGLKGAFFVERPSEDSDRFAVDATVLVDGVAAVVVESKLSGGRPVIRLDRDAVRGAELQIPRSQLPQLPEDTYYAFELVGLEVEEETGRTLGRVREVVSGVANDVLELDSGLALPMVEDCISLIDLAAARIVVRTGFAEPNRPPES
ncbi:MAG TPA: ribosome maturation factor RimM [Gaiellaceae bacterium]